MFKYERFIDVADAIIKKDFEYWFNNLAAEDVTFAYEYINQYDDGNFKISNIFASQQATLPYVTFELRDLSESVVDFSGNMLGRVGIVEFDFEGPVYNLDGAVWAFTSKRYGRKYVVDFPSVLFDDPTSVPLSHFTSVILPQLPANAMLFENGDTVKIIFVNDVITVESDFLGVVAGEYEGVWRSYRHRIYNANLLVNIGAESYKTREQLEDIVLIYFKRVRDEKRSLGSIEDMVVVNLSSEFNITGRNEISFGASDMLSLLYSSSVSGKVIIEGTDIEGVELKKVTGITPL